MSAALEPDAYGRRSWVFVPADRPEATRVVGIGDEDPVLRDAVGRDRVAAPAVRVVDRELLRLAGDRHGVAQRHPVDRVRRLLAVREELRGPAVPVRVVLDHGGEPVAVRIVEPERGRLGGRPVVVVRAEEGRRAGGPAPLGVVVHRADGLPAAVAARLDERPQVLELPIVDARPEARVDGVGKPACRDGGEQRREVARDHGHAGGVDRDHGHALEPAGRLVVVERACHGAVRDHGGDPERHQGIRVAAAVFDRDERAGRGHERPEVAAGDRSGRDAERPVRAEGTNRNIQAKAVERITRSGDGHRAARGADRLLDRQRRLAEGEATGDWRRRLSRRWNVARLERREDERLELTRVVLHLRRRRGLPASAREAGRGACSRRRSARALRRAGRAREEGGDADHRHGEQRNPGDGGRCGAAAAPGPGDG